MILKQYACGAVRYAAVLILEDISGNGISRSRLAGVNYASPEPVTLMFQAGYLTIKSYDARFGQHNLDYKYANSRNENIKITH